MTSQDFYMGLLSEGNQSSQQSAQTSTPAYAHSTSDSDTASRVEALIAELRASGRDITADYGDWLKVGFALASEFGESGRRYFHDISSIYSGYNQEESDTKYSECLKSDNGRTDISTLFYLAKNQGITLRRVSIGPQLSNASPSTKGQSDKNVPLTLSLDDPEEMPTLPMFPEDIFSTLPGLLRKVTDLMLTHQERSLVLIGSIATLSSALLPMYTIYFGKTIYPNMYLFVPGPAGAGKGKLDFCFRLVKPIHKEKLERWTIAKDEYKKEYARYKRQKKGDNIDPPEKPPIQLLRVPANSSATSFAQAMAENGNLILFETEGDTVVNTFNSDFGNYSDSFRKAFAHESFGYLRRGDDGEEREIENPRLSTVLSGTPEQVKSLIHDAENGLLSRFMFFCINSTPEWLDGFDSYGGDDPLEDSFDAIGQEFTAFTKILEQTPRIKFTLSISQSGKFNDFFAAEKERMHEFNGDRYSASSHRLAWCFLRVAMVLSALRLMDSGRITENVECNDVDFDTTMKIIKVISTHNDYIFNVLDKERPEGIAVADSYSSATRKAIISALPGYFTTEDMKKVAANVGKSLRTVRRQIARAIEAGEIQQVKHGEYKKM
ncbi:MAG: DUF3987 domain-containing protein [Bacteroidales bacterium]|nr:DUF3987 domain-containing protein [Bacteroidales bacterium]